MVNKKGLLITGAAVLGGIFLISSKQSEEEVLPLTSLGGSGNGFFPLSNLFTGSGSADNPANPNITIQEQPLSFSPNLIGNSTEGVQAERTAPTGSVAGKIAGLDVQVAGVNELGSQVVKNEFGGYSPVGSSGVVLAQSAPAPVISTSNSLGSSSSSNSLGSSNSSSSSSSSTPLSRIKSNARRTSVTSVFSSISRFFRR